MDFLTILVIVVLLLTIFGTVGCILEMFLPGIGFFGISGIICLIISSILSISAFDVSPLYIFICQIAIVVIVGFISYTFIKNSNFVNRIILKEVSETGYDDMPTNNELLNKIGITKTPLKPVGIIAIDNKDIEVLSNDGYINSKEYVIIDDIVKNKIFVKKYNEEV